MVPRMTDNFVVGSYSAFLCDCSHIGRWQKFALYRHTFLNVNVNLIIFPNCSIFVHFQESDFGAYESPIKQC